MFSLKEKTERILAEAGVAIGGSQPWDIQVHDQRFYWRVLTQGSVGLGESYVAGWWDCQKLDEFFFRLLRARLHVKYKGIGQDLFHFLANALFNRQSPKRAFEVGERHYDLGNDLFQVMLDKRLTYTCGYWEGAANLDDAQERKLDLVCRKLRLKPGDRVLDIGCGFGSFARYAAERYRVHVTGITISKEQLVLAKELTKGLSVDILFQDYRDIQGMFDHIVSIGMFEAVGQKNFRVFMRIVSGHLKADGIFLLHTIGGNFSGINVDPWTEKYIFPNGILPTVAQIGTAIDRLFVIEDWHNFGADYEKTLMAWHHNFEAHWEQLGRRLSERFHRMWTYFLLSAAGTFRARDAQLWQIVLTQGGLLGGYKSIR